jgi:signal peptidase I
VDTTEITPLTQKSGGFNKFRRDWIEPILVAFILALFIRTFIIQPFKIPSGSMEDTLLIGDQLIAAKFYYGTKLPFTQKKVFKFRDPRPGDIIVFKYPEDPSKDFIKRCIAVSGQTVEIRNKRIYVDGILQPLPKHAKFVDPSILPSQFNLRDNYPLTRIPLGMVFMMGDNRDNSNDSRFWGFAPVENIKGKAIFIYWSWDKDSHLYNILSHIRWSRPFSIIR